MKLDEITLFFNKISSKKNKKLDSKLKFEFDDGVVFVDDTKDKIEINNLDLKSDCSIKISNSNFEKLIKKELNTSMALMSGDITIEGDMNIALKISDLFE